MPFFISLIFVAMTFAPEKVTPMDLSSFQWKNRLLFLFAPDASDPDLQHMKSQISAQTEEVQDRDLVVFEVLETGQSRMNSSGLEPQTADWLRNRFDVPRNEFTLILIGKDGGVKLVSENRVGLKEIFELIDSMPMRKNEMRRKKK